LLVPLDTTILTNFAQVGITKVITDLWGEQTCTTVDAFREYSMGITAAGLSPLAWRQLNILKPTSEEENIAAVRWALESVRAWQ
jgi:hypothetical protein